MHPLGSTGRVRTKCVPAPNLLECRHSSTRTSHEQAPTAPLLPCRLGAQLRPRQRARPGARRPSSSSSTGASKARPPSSCIRPPRATSRTRSSTSPIDAGNGSGGTVTRVASGAYDMGFADLAALMEFHANNPTAPNKPVAVMMVYNNTPAAVLALKKSGIKKPADLAGKKLGAPVFDAGRKALPIFAKANGIGNVNWTAMDPTLRETMLVRGDIDAITGFSFTSLLNLEARGVKAERHRGAALPRLRREALRQRDHRLAQAAQGEPGGGQGLPARLHQGRQGRDRRSEAGPSQSSRRATASSTRRSRLRRLKLALDRHRDHARRRGRRLRRGERGPRLSLMASQVSDAFAPRSASTPTRSGTAALPAARRRAQHLRRKK